jgi:hypothetical protein
MEARAVMRLVQAFPAASCKVEAKERALVHGNSVGRRRLRRLRRGMHRNRQVNKNGIKVSLD